MIAFKISINGKKLCVAGVRDFGVLSAIVTWVRRPPEQTRRRRGIEEELTAQIAGLDSHVHEHVRWLSRRLRVGDRLAIEIVDAARVDRPTERYRDDPKRIERAKRRYVERLKKELSSASARRRASGAQSRS